MDILAIPKPSMPSKDSVFDTFTHIVTANPVASGAIVLLLAGSWFARKNKVLATLILGAIIGVMVYVAVKNH